MTGTPVQIINLEIKDNHEEAILGAFLILQLCDMVMLLHDIVNIKYRTVFASVSMIVLLVAKITNSTELQYDHIRECMVGIRRVIAVSKAMNPLYYSLCHISQLKFPGMVCRSGGLMGVPVRDLSLETLIGGLAVEVVMWVVDHLVGVARHKI